MTFENNISKKKNSLLVIGEQASPTEEWLYLINNFCGQVIYDSSSLQKAPKQVYACGDMSQLPALEQPVQIIQELSSNYTPPLPDALQ